jgi:hypothetical protein
MLSIVKNVVVIVYLLKTNYVLSNHSLFMLIQAVVKIGIITTGCKDKKVE